MKIASLKDIMTQCSKLRFCFVHLPGAKALKMVHPAINSCVTHNINGTYLKVGKSMHTPGAQVSNPVHPAPEMCTLGAGCTCTLNFTACSTSSLIPPVDNPSIVFV